jgi:hypothetical protein
MTRPEPWSLTPERPYADQVNRFVSDEQFPPSLKEEIQAHFDASTHLVADYSQAQSLCRKMAQVLNLFKN